LYVYSSICTPWLVKVLQDSRSQFETKMDIVASSLREGSLDALAQANLRVPGEVTLGL
jgi:hypothetical protein